MGPEHQNVEKAFTQVSVQQDYTLRNKWIPWPLL